MTDTGTIIEFKGPISYRIIERLLDKLRSAPEFLAMNKPTRKKVYGAFVESIDNIYKYAAGSGTGERNKNRPSLISVKKQDDRYLITAGNLIQNDDLEEFRFKLDRVRQLDRENLKTLYEDIINREPGEDDKGAGLGLVTIALKTEHKIRYSFTPVDSDHSFFEIQIIINE